MEYVIIGATAWLGVSVLTAAGRTWLRAESRHQREIEDQEDLARALGLYPECTRGGVHPATTAARIA